jgi:hypothetical protein
VTPRSAETATTPKATEPSVPSRPPIEELLRHPDAYLYRGDLFALGLGRRAVDAIFRAIGQDVPGSSRPAILVADWLDYRETFTYRRDKPDRVRPGRR